jgi:NADH-quinone oxidoreductase subunit L
LFLALSSLLTIFIGVHFLNNPLPLDGYYIQHLWSWIATESFKVSFAFRLDMLSLLMIFVVTFVGLLIAIYASEFMEEYGEERRFFACMNLFVCNMLILILADNLLLTYLGWEGVGLCSFLLIGFWYKDPKNGRCARKAFITTRVGDTALAIGLFLLFKDAGTLDIAQLQQISPNLWGHNDQSITLITLLLLGGAVGKSAQIPLQTWLPDAMVGPTPVSALIHAATMVTAGVYLIARTHFLFDLAPLTQNLTAHLGLFTLLLAGASACVQKDIKRVLAYSTVSQIG